MGLSITSDNPRGEGVSAFVVSIPETMYDSVSGRRLCFARHLADVGRSVKAPPYPTFLYCSQGCKITIHNSDEIPIDDLRCPHGMFLQFVVEPIPPS